MFLQVCWTHRCRFPCALDSGGAAASSSLLNGHLKHEASTGPRPSPTASHQWWTWRGWEPSAEISRWGWSSEVCCGAGCSEPPPLWQERPGWKLRHRARRWFSESFSVVNLSTCDTNRTFLFYRGCFSVGATGYRASVCLIYGVISRQPEWTLNVVEAHCVFQHLCLGL